MNWFFPSSSLKKRFNSLLLRDSSSKGLQNPLMTMSVNKQVFWLRGHPPVLPSRCSHNSGFSNLRLSLQRRYRTGLSPVSLFSQGRSQGHFSTFAVMFTLFFQIASIDFLRNLF